MMEALLGGKPIEEDAHKKRSDKTEHSCPGFHTRNDTAAGQNRANRQRGRTTVGGIGQVRETRPQWSEHPFHYDFRTNMDGRLLYIETILVEDDPDDPAIHVVSIHDA